MLIAQYCSKLATHPMDQLCIFSFESDDRYRYCSAIVCEGDVFADD
jgi:hypothetical protein